MDPPQVVHQHRDIFQDDDDASQSTLSYLSKANRRASKLFQHNRLGSRSEKDMTEISLTNTADIDLLSQQGSEAQSSHQSPPGHYNRSSSLELMDRIDHLLSLQMDGIEAFNDEEENNSGSVLSMAHMSTSSGGFGVDTKLDDSKQGHGPPVLISKLPFKPALCSSHDDNNPYFDKDSVYSSVGTQSVGSSNDFLAKQDGLIRPKCNKDDKDGVADKHQKYRFKEKRKASGIPRAALFIALFLLILCLGLLCYAVFVANVNIFGNGSTEPDTNDDDFWVAYLDQPKESTEPTEPMEPMEPTKVTEPEKKSETDDSKKGNTHLFEDDGSGDSFLESQALGKSSGPTPTVPTARTSPSRAPSRRAPSRFPTVSPTKFAPALFVSDMPSESLYPSVLPSQLPSDIPSDLPSDSPNLIEVSSSEEITDVPTSSPTWSPTWLPTTSPTMLPTWSPTMLPSESPSGKKRRE